MVGLVPPYLVVAQGVAARHGADNPELPSIVGTILPADWVSAISIIQVFQDLEDTLDFLLMIYMRT